MLIYLVGDNEELKWVYDRLKEATPLWDHEDGLMKEDELEGSTGTISVISTPQKHIIRYLDLLKEEHYEGSPMPVYDVSSMEETTKFLYKVKEANDQLVKKEEQAIREQHEQRSKTPPPVAGRIQRETEGGC